METPLTPLEFARRTRRLHGHREGVVDGDLRLTYEQFFDRCDRWSAALQQLGVAPGDRVATIAPNTHAQLESFYAVPQIGAVLVPINYRLTPEDFVYIINHSGASVVCVDADYLDAVDSVRDQLREVRHFVAFEGARDGWLDYEAAIAAASPDFTPGGRGRARPAHDQLHQRDHGAPQGRDDQPPQRDDELDRHPAAPADAGGRAVPVDAADVPRERLDLHLDRDGRRGDPRLPAQGRAGRGVPADPRGERAPPVRRAHRADLAGQRACRGARRGAARRGRGHRGGAPAAATIERLEGEFGWDVTQVYGLTETAPFITVCAPLPEHEELHARRPGGRQSPAGVELLTSGELRVQGDDGEEVPADGQTLGEIVVRGNVVMSGYYHDPEATDRAMGDGWFHTGDAAVVHPDGYVEIRDRIKDVIISGGENISSVEVEGTLLRHPAVQEAAIVGLPDERWGETPQAFVVLRDGQTATEEEIIAFARERLAHFKAPRGVTFVTELPKTATGKIQKYVLRSGAPNLARQ